MFGSKIRSWMEHVVRPRKKANKNKNGNGNLVSANTSSEYKATVYQNETNITSPATVSPIQIHNTSRKGWQSPSQDNSPKPDYSFNSPKTKTATIKAKASIKSSSPKVLPKRNNQSNRYLTTAPTTMYQMNEIDHSMQSNSTPKTINNNNLHYNTSSTLNYSTTTSSSNEILDDPAIIHKSKYIPIGISSSSSSSLNSTIPTTKQPSQKFLQQETNNNTIRDTTITTRMGKDEHKYGKIQPINKYIDKYRIADRFNGNTTPDDYSHIETNNNNTNNTDKFGKNINCQLMSNNNSIKSNSEHTNRCFLGGNGGNQISQSKQQLLNTKYRNGNAPGSGNGGSVGKTTQINSNTNSGYSGPGHHHPGTQGQGYHVVNHVSSPESAYSTGYSTDGTSPGGCSYTPEYYINMRTGVHYFAKGNATIGTDNRFKCGLNRIEEKHDEQICVHKRTESCDFGPNVNLLNASPKLQPVDYNNRSRITTTVGTSPHPHSKTNNSSNVNASPTMTATMSPVLRKNVATAHFRTPSPRQRCRIRTNPWFSNNVDPIILNVDCKTFSKKIDLDSGSTSSGIKSNSDESNEMNRSTNRKTANHLSDSDSTSSSTEKNASRTYRSMTEYKKSISKKENPLGDPGHQDNSDDDATLNEMMGKFDESYVYEKENDILSDSDPTDCCASTDDLEGRDAGDECDSEDLLDIDYIDNGTVTEVDIDKEKLKNTGNCSYHFVQDKDKKKLVKVRKGSKNSEANSKRRKKLVRKRNKNSESSTRTRSPVVASRGCRSVGGTPVSIRRNDKSERRQMIEANTLSNRSSSLTFTEIHAIRSRMLAISDSEKALIKADLEADVKYKQLIQEAETILISMKSNSVAPKKEPPVPSICSPRRVCNVPTNKRVEMLRNCEADLKRELSKTSHKVVEQQNAVPHGVVNKRLEILRYETVSAPSSPRTNRIAPMKTHITNFIYQNSETQCEILPRKVSLESSNADVQLRLNGKPLTTPKSPALPRRQQFHNQAPIDSDSDSENDQPIANRLMNRCRNNNKENLKQNVSNNKPPLISFRSVVCNNIQEDSYFPQSEPLKRKIYTCNSTIDKIQRSLDFDSESPKKQLLHRIQLLRKERQAEKLKERKETEEHLICEQTVLLNQDPTDENIKRKLIMKTIEDIKRSLEDQSLELNELHDSDA